MGLFALGPSTRKLRSQHLKYVAAQVKESLQDHLGDTTEEFDRWIEDPKSNLIHRIAKRADCRLNRQEVREALLELGWRSFHLLGRCVDAQMRTFRDAIPGTLGRAEEEAFRQLYLSHPSLGGLPLLLLQDRLDFLNEALSGMLIRPRDRQAIAMVHTMLYYYSVLAGNRRAADRDYKRRARHRARSGRVSRDETSRDEAATSQETLHCDSFGDIARRLATAKGFDCEFGDAEWQARLVSVDDDRIVFYIICPERDFDETLYVSREEFRTAGENVLE
jgi:hypothetical protein